MLARELAEQVPTVRRDTTGAEAVKVMAEYRMHGVVVAGADAVPEVVIPGSQLLGLVLPAYVRDEPGLAHAFDEASADALCARLNATTIGELLDSQALQAQPLPSVLPEDTMIEIAAIMVSRHLPLIVVRDRDGVYRGTILLSRVLAGIATLAGHDSALIRRRLERDLIDRGRPWLPPEYES